MNYECLNCGEVMSIPEWFWDKHFFDEPKHKCENCGYENKRDELLDDDVMEGL